MKNFFFLLTALISLLGTTINAQEDTKASKSLLWKISGNGMQKPSYLFGTIHIICKDDYVWTDKMKKSFDAAGEVCMEMDMDDPSILMEIASGMMNKDGKKLEEYFSPSEYKLVEQYFRDSVGVSIGMFAGMKPIVLQTLLTTTASPDCDSAVSYEIKLSEAAAQQHKEITGLETPSEQITLLDKIPVDSIIKELVNIATRKDSSIADISTMIQAYKNQDIPELYNQIQKAKQEGDNLDAFLDERNEKWIDRMAERMDQRSVFFAVGAGHLWGPKGLINLLREQGYTVTPLR